MARRRSIVFTAPLIALAMFVFIIVMTVIVNIILHTFADDVAEWITKMPTFKTYNNYVPTTTMLCSEKNYNADISPSKGEFRNWCESECDDTGWEFKPDGDKFLCASYTDLDKEQLEKYRYNANRITAHNMVEDRAGFTKPDTTADQSIFDTFIVPGSKEYPTRAANNPFTETMKKLQSGTDGQPSRLPFYYMLAGIGFVILAINVMIAAVYWVIEDTPFGKKGQAMTIITGVIKAGIIILLIPIIWDPIAVFSENAGLFIMSPDGRHAGDITALVILEAGTITWPEANFNDVFNNIMSNPLGILGGLGEAIGKSLQDIFVGLILSFAKAQATVMTVIALFITSIIRVEITMIVLMMYPIAVAIHIMPFFGQTETLYQKVKETMIAAPMAPVLGGIVFVIGFASLESLQAVDEWALDRWIVALTILHLASGIPIAGIAWVSEIANKTTDIINSSMQTAMTVGAPAAGAMSGMLAGGKTGTAATGAAKGGAKMAGGGIKAAGSAFMSVGTRVFGAGNIKGELQSGSSPTGIGSQQQKGIFNRFKPSHEPQIMMGTGSTGAPVIGKHGTVDEEIATPKKSKSRKDEAADIMSEKPIAQPTKSVASAGTVEGGTATQQTQAKTTTQSKKSSGGNTKEEGIGSFMTHGLKGLGSSKSGIGSGPAVQGMFTGLGGAAATAIAQGQRSFGEGVEKSAAKERKKMEAALNDRAAVGAPSAVKKTPKIKNAQDMGLGSNYQQAPTPQIREGTLPGDRTSRVKSDGGLTSPTPLRDNYIEKDIIPARPKEIRAEKEVLEQQMSKMNKSPSDYRADEREELSNAYQAKKAELEKSHEYHELKTEPERQKHLYDNNQMATDSRSGYEQKHGIEPKVPETYRDMDSYDAGKSSNKIDMSSRNQATELEDMSKTERESINRASGGGNTPTDYDATNNVKPTSDSIETTTKTKELTDTTTNSRKNIHKRGTT